MGQERSFVQTFPSSDEDMRACLGERGRVRAGLGRPQRLGDRINALQDHMRAARSRATAAGAAAPVQRIGGPRHPTDYPRALTPRLVVLTEVSDKDAGARRLAQLMKGWPVPHTGSMRIFKSTRDTVGDSSPYDSTSKRDSAVAESYTSSIRRSGKGIRVAVNVLPGTQGAPWGPGVTPTGQRP